PAAAADHRPQRRRQDDRAQDAGALCAHGPGRLSPAGGGRVAAARVRGALRDHRRRAIGRRESLDVLGVREADPRAAGRGRRPLATAVRLGLAPALIERAQAHRSTDAARVSQLIAWLDEASRCEAERTIAMERRESETAARLAAARESEAGATARAREIVERAKAEAAVLLTDVRRAVA